MEWIKISMIALGMLIVSFGCAGNSSNKSNEAEEDVLFATDVAFAQASSDRGPAEAFNMYLANEAVQLPAGSIPIMGREAIYQSMKQGGDAALAWAPVKAEVAKSGDLGYTWGTYQSSYRGPDGSMRTSHGKYLNVWKKHSTGEWKVLIDMGNSSPAPSDTPGK
ncbi:MAG: nuclear transport factor 2 family protein [Candidatus Latescibacterota bacterium]